MRLEFAHTWALVLIPILIALVIYTGIKMKRIKSRMTGEIAIRCIVITLIVLAISGVSIRRQSDMTTTVFLLDMSDSMKGQWQQEIEFVQKSIADMPNKNQAGVVVFGADAQIEQFVSDKKIFTDVQSQVTASATNLQQAVSTAIALFPNETAKRLIILTDGAENEGNLSELAASVAASDTEIKLVKYGNSVAQEVYVSDVSLPEAISEGDKFEVKVEIYASEPTNAKVSLYSGRTLKGQKEVTLQKGDNQLVFSDQGVENGIKSYRVTVDADKDTVTVNNTYSAFTKVQAQSKILLVEGNSKEAKPFCDVLDAANYSYDLVSPAGVPNSVSDMLQYKSVVLLNVYADDLRKGFMDTLETYVKDYAGGLACIGGKDSYALGNYRDTKLEEVLPVKMDLEGEKEIPSIAMVMVIDHSGSMESPSKVSGGASCLDVAKNAAVNSLDSLRPIDQVGVLAFDDSYDWAVELQPATDVVSIQEKIESISIRGGTSIYPALEEAEKAIEKSDAQIKHIVLLTDGEDAFKDYDGLLTRMNEQGITLSTVAVGESAAVDLMMELAEKGNGRYYYSDAGTSLPRIFAQEVYLSTESYLINEEFVPTITNTHDIIRDIFTDGSPSLLGYVATTPKDSATVILESHKKDPILAAWQCGLGRTVAWTSDGTNQWTGNFAGWDNYPMLWRNIIDWTIYDDEMGDDTIAVAQKASSAVITYTTSEYDGDTKLGAVLTDEEGNTKDATLVAISPGVYQAEVPLSETGVYSINVRKSQGDEVVKTMNTATAMQYSQEYRYAEVSNSVDGFVAQVSGRIIQDTKEVFDTELEGASARRDLTMWFMLLAAIVFVLDVVFRRMRIDWIVAVRGMFKRKAKLIPERAEKRATEKPVADKPVADKSTPDKPVVEKTVATATKPKRKKPVKKAKATETNVIDTSALLKKKEERNL